MEAKTVRYPLLCGEYELTVDEKNRVLMPAEIRRSIPPDFGESLYLVLGTNSVPWLYPERCYEDMVMQMPVDMIPADDLLAYDQLHFAMASKVSWDKQGRVLISDRMLKGAGIGKDVTLIGVRDHLELWDRSNWNVRRDDLKIHSAEITARARVVRNASQGSVGPVNS